MRIEFIRWMVQKIKDDTCDVQQIEKTDKSVHGLFGQTLKSHEIEREDLEIQGESLPKVGFHVDHPVIV